MCTAQAHQPPPTLRQIMIPQRKGTRQPGLCKMGMLSPQAACLLQTWTACLYHQASLCPDQPSTTFQMRSAPAPPSYHVVGSPHDCVHVVTNHINAACKLYGSRALMMITFTLCVCWASIYDQRAFKRPADASFHWSTSTSCKICSWILHCIRCKIFTHFLLQCLQLRRICIMAHLATNQLACCQRSFPCPYLICKWEAQRCRVFLNKCCVCFRYVAMTKGGMVMQVIGFESDEEPMAGTKQQVQIFRCMLGVKSCPCICLAAWWHRQYPLRQPFARNSCSGFTALCHFDRCRAYGWSSCASSQLLLHMQCLTLASRKDIIGACKTTLIKFSREHLLSCQKALLHPAGPWISTSSAPALSGKMQEDVPEVGPDLQPVAVQGPAVHELQMGAAAGSQMQGDRMLAQAAASGHNNQALEHRVPHNTWANGHAAGGGWVVRGQS